MRRYSCCKLRKLVRFQESYQLRRGLVLRNWLQFLEFASGRLADVRRLLGKVLLSDLTETAIRSQDEAKGKCFRQHDQHGSWGTLARYLEAVVYAVAES